MPCIIVAFCRLELGYNYIVAFCDKIYDNWCVYIVYCMCIIYGIQYTILYICMYTYNFIYIKFACLILFCCKNVCNTLCMWINVGILVYPTLYKELGNNIVIICDGKTIKQLRCGLYSIMYRFTQVNCMNADQFRQLYMQMDDNINTLCDKFSLDWLYRLYCFTWVYFKCE